MIEIDETSPPAPRASRYRVKVDPRAGVRLDNGRAPLRPGERVVWEGEAPGMVEALKAAAATPEGREVPDLVRMAHLGEELSRE